MAINKGMMSSATDDWATPWDLFRRIEAEWGPFDMDVCATAQNAKVPRFFSPEDDGLNQVWVGRCWMNPPYGRQIGAWVRKAREAAENNGAVVVCLLPARTDTAWWHDNVIGGMAKVVFLRGRVRFSDRGPAPFPSAIVVFGVAV